MSPSLYGNSLAVRLSSRGGIIVAKVPLALPYFVVSYEEKGYCRVVSVGQLRFDCRFYCWRSSRIQGSW